MRYGLSPGVRQLPRLRITTFIECAGVRALVIATLRAGGVGGWVGGLIFRTIRFSGQVRFSGRCCAVLAGLPWDC